MKAKVTSRGPAAQMVPVRAGFPIPRGDIRPGRAVLTVNGQPRLDAQVEELATWEDGSVAHAMFSWRQDMGPAGESIEIDAQDGARPALSDPWHPLVKKLLPLFDLEIKVIEAGIEWSLRAGPSEGAAALSQMLGTRVPHGESRLIEVLTAPQLFGQDHPYLRARIRIRIPTDTDGFIWEVVLENCNATASIVDVAFSEILVRWGGDTRVIPAGIFQAGRRIVLGGWAGRNEPHYDVVLDGALLELLMLSPPIEWDGSCDAAAGVALFNSLAKERDSAGKPSRGPAPATPNELPDPMSAFPLYRSGGDTGDRADIGVLPLWSIAYLNGGSEAACALQRMADTTGSAAFPIHWRDPALDEIGVRHGHPVWKSGFAPDVGVKSGEKPDVAHHALAGALTYLATGSLTALEELRSWALLSVRLAYPNDGSLQTPGDRREAWALRTISIAARFSPDHDTQRRYFQDCLTKTAAEWSVALPRIKRDCPLGNMSVGSWHPSGRKESPCSYVGSMWQQAWFLFEALAADELMGAPLFRPLVEHGWNWWLGFLDSGTTWTSPANGDKSRWTLDLLVDYSTPVGTYLPVIVTDPKTGRQSWSEVPGTWMPIQDRGALAWQARIYLDHGKSPLLPADMPASPAPEYWLPAGGALWTPVVGSRWWEYGFGRPGLHVVARRFGLAQAQEVANVAFPLVDQDHQQKKRATWARVRA